MIDGKNFFDWPVKNDVITFAKSQQVMDMII